MYCPKCKSKLFPEDDNYIKVTGVCSYCVTYSKNGNLQLTYTNYMQAQAQPKGKKNDRNKTIKNL